MVNGRDAEFMRLALIQAKLAFDLGEVPVGAVITMDDEVIASGHNLRETTGDPTAHAETVAIRAASGRIGHWRLVGCTLYVTLEPCAMCAGAIVNARVSRCVFGAYDLRFGCCGTVYNILGDRKLNHHPEVEGGILEPECAGLLKDFFRAKR